MKCKQVALAAPESVTPLPSSSFHNTPSPPLTTAEGGEGEGKEIKGRGDKLSKAFVVQKGKCDRRIIKKMTILFAYKYLAGQVFVRHGPR
jgi:hypothetical protein